ncbi:hypothetical protein PROFUN_02017 [Planoprotostelium fungivorum]|uniref:Zn(2)-C6 fungal-type domain-containing protein n=1 Tax=Planoprotostelium fungivorum TaxID=1890364 RepID=A0A2P6NB64_9EUKA|nr:hypothetical protein PROFUN_02017 [Planoprotostelium fungivorum]
MSHNQPVLKACLACRARHVRCDGNEPVCNRCSSKNVQCEYTKSRRGGKRKRILPPTEEQQSSPSVLDINIQDAFLADVGSSPNLLLSQLLMLDDSLDQPSPLSLHPVGSTDPSHSELIRQFYKRIHPAHPLLPREEDMDDYIRHLIDPQPLLNAIYDIASLFNHRDPSTQPSRWTTAEDVERIQQGPPSLESVQTLLLYSLYEYVTVEIDRAQEFCDAAISMAEQSKWFVSDPQTENRGQIIREASSRRTACEIFIVHCMMVSITGYERIRIGIRNEDILLYSNDLSQHQPQISLADFNRWLLLGDDRATDFSVGIRLKSAFLLRRVVLLNQQTYDLAALNDSDIQITTLRLNFLLDIAAIHLHKARSSLFTDHILEATSSPCTQSLCKSSSFSKESTIHDQKCTKAASDIAHLINQSVFNCSEEEGITTRGPFLCCALALSVVIHLAVRDEKMLRMEMAALKMLSHVYPISHAFMSFARQQVKSISFDGLQMNEFIQ